MEEFAYMAERSVGMLEITSDTVEVVPFLQRELANICIAINPRKSPCLRRGTCLRGKKIPFLKALTSASPNGVG